MPPQIDLELLRRLGILPGTALPGGLPGGDTSSKGDAVETAAPENAPSPSYNTPTIPWRQTTPSTIPGAPDTTRYLNLPKTPTPGGGWGITAPEGMAAFEPSTAPSTYVSSTPTDRPFEPRTTDTAAMLAEKEGQRKAAEALANQRAEQAATVNVRNQMYQKDMMQRALQQLTQTNPAQALQFMQQQQTGGLTPAQLTAGSDEAQAFRMIVAQQGLPAALAWLQQQGGGRRGPLTPDEIYQQAVAEVRGRFGPEAQGLRGDVAAATGAGGLTGRSEATMNLPVLAKRGNWVKPETGEFAKETDTPADLVQRGFQFVDDKARTATATARAALAQITQYRDLTQRLLPDVSESGGFLGNLTAVQSNRARLMALRAAGHPDARRLEGMFGMIATIARATGDTANIAVQERNMLHESVVTPEDSKQSALAKLDQLETILRSVLRGWGTTVGYKQESEVSQTSQGPFQQVAPAAAGVLGLGKTRELPRANPGEEVRQDRQGRSYVNRGGQVIEVQR